MSDETINVTINLDGLRNELRVSLQRTICLVSAGLQAAKAIDEDRLQLPTNSMTMTYAPDLKFSAEEITQQYSSWILTNGFRDSIECVNTFLESAHQVLSMWKLLGRQNETVRVNGADWNAMFDGIKKFHRLGFPDKLEHIKVKHNIELNDKFTEQLRSINAVRNCLVHRRGIVSDRDITENNQLQVKWTRLQFVLTNEDGEKELVFGERVEKESWVGMRSLDEMKAFTLDDAIYFSAKEFASIPKTKVGV